LLKNPDIDLSPDLLEALQRVCVPTATHHLVRRGFHNTFAIGVVPHALQTDQVMVGRARTLRFLPLREDLLEAQYDTVTERPHRIAIESIQPGQVLVVDAGGSVQAGVAGDMYTRRVQARGGTGIVVDGAVRDIGAIRQVGLPVFCRGVHGAGISRALMSVDVDQPIQIGGVPVLPGDVLLGDINGVVVIPPQEVEALVEYVLEQDDQERFTRAKLAEGYPLHRVYPLDAEMLEAYQAWSEGQRASDGGQRR
jgi:regulator of RNase E activity RraA